MGAGWKQVPAQLDDAGLKTMLTGLGYEVEEAGAGTYEVAQKTADQNVPTRVFLS